MKKDTNLTRKQMEVINADMKEGNFRPAYLFYGSQDYLKNQYKLRMRKALLAQEDTMNYSCFTEKECDAQQIIDQAETMPFFADKRMILIENSGFFKKACPELADYLDRIPQESILVFVEDAVDKKNKLYKKIEKIGRIGEFNKLSDTDIQKWLLGMVKKAGKNITESTLRLFMDRAGEDMQNIQNEMEKLLCFTMEKDSIERADILEVCTVTTENQVFEMIRLVTEKRQKEALDLYYDLLAAKERPLRILPLVARQFNQLYQVADMREQGLGVDSIAAAMKLSSYVVKHLISQAAGYKKDVLKKAVLDCVEYEEAAKTGKMEEHLPVEIIIVEYSS